MMEASPLGRCKAKSAATSSMVPHSRTLRSCFDKVSSFPDRVRGIFNEGGLFGERAGWHLPGFDVSNWVTRDLSDSLPGDNSGVGFFVTTFELHIPEGYDVPISFVFDAEHQPYRAQLFVNGWNFGKRVANLG